MFCDSAMHWSKTQSFEKKKKRNAVFNIHNPFLTVNSICSLKWWLIQSIILILFLRRLVQKPKGTGEIESCHQCKKSRERERQRKRASRIKQRGRAQSNTHTRALMLFVCLPQTQCFNLKDEKTKLECGELSSRVHSIDTNFFMFPAANH